ncbi:MAG: hypothetical protein ABII12_01585 [Planctomycetota bacterium]
MQANQRLTIGVLSVTAMVLLVGIILATTGGQNQALAFGQLDRGGDYVLVTGQFTLNTELVYVTDAAAKKLNVYSYDRTRREIILWDSHDLTKEFGETRP